MLGLNRIALAVFTPAALVFASCAPTPSDNAAKESAGVASEQAGQDNTVLAPFTDHYSMRIEKPADVVWEHLKRLYVEGGRQREQGFEVTKLDGDLTAYLGGTKGVMPEATERPEVTIRVSAIDEDVRLLSLQIDLENPVPVYVVHQVRPEGENASIYQNIIMTKWPVTAPEGKELTPQFVREKMLADVAFHNTEVEEIMQREKAVIEALD